MRKPADRPNHDTGKPRARQRWADYASLGIMFPASTAVGFLMGYGLDRWLGTEPILTIVLTLYGVAAGFVNLFRVTRRNGN